MSKGERGKTINSTNVLKCQSEVAQGRKTKLGKRIQIKNGELNGPDPTLSIKFPTETSSLNPKYIAGLLWQLGLKCGSAD